MGTIAAVLDSDNSVTPSIRKLLSNSEGPVNSVDSISQNGFAIGSTVNNPNPNAELFVLKDDGYILALDGLIHNRSTVADSLGIKHDDKSTITDEELLLAAYRHWGEECVEHIIGDFAFFIWSVDDEKLFGARDRTGVRSLYYAQVPNGIFLCSEIGPLLTHSSVDIRLNEGMLAEHLSRTLSTRDQTFYQDIQKLPPGNTLVADATDIRRKRYWLPTDGPSLGSLSEDELINRFRKLLDQVLSEHIRHPSQSAILMSGGLDSTAVACHARKITGCRIPAISAVFDTLPTLDESKRIQAVSDYCDIPVIYTYGDNHWPLSSRECYEPALRGGPRCDMNVPLNATLYQRAAAEGRPVLFTGIGGNAFDGSRLSYSDRLSDGNVVGVVTDMVRDSSSTMRLLYWYGLGQIAPRLASSLASLKRTSDPSPQKLMGAKLRDNVNINKRLSSDEIHLDWNESIRHMWRNDLGVHRDFALAGERRLGRHIGVEFRYPLLDARIVEFVFNLPSKYRFRAGEKKYIFREAMLNRLPKSVRTQRKTVEFSPIVNQGFRGSELDQIRSLCTNSRLVERGYVNRDALDNILDSYLDGDNSKVVDVWNVVGAELWFRQIS